MSRAVQALGAAAVVLTAAVSLRRRRHTKPEELVRRYYDAWADGDADTVRRLVADDYCGHVHTLAGTEERRRDELDSLVQSHSGAFEEVEYAVHDVLSDDGRVAARMTMRARHAETGRRGEIDGLAILRLDGGRIAEEWSSWDYLGLVEQLGLAKVS